MKFKTILINSAKYLLLFFVLNFTLAFLYEYYSNGTPFLEFYGTFRFGYIFVIMAIIAAIYRTKKEENEKS